jgi:hypothetical protein
MTVGFFTWLALLRRFDLSYLYPFEGVDRVLLAVAAWLILRRKRRGISGSGRERCLGARVPQLPAVRSPRR